MAREMGPEAQRQAIKLVGHSMAFGLTFGLMLAFILSLAGCTSEPSGTFGPYAADAYGRTECSFSVRVENGGLCPRIPIPVIAVAGLPAPERKPPVKGCGFWDYAGNYLTCPAPDIAPGEDVSDAPVADRYCYRTLGKTECYDRPASDSHRQPISISPNTALAPGAQIH